MNFWFKVGILLCVAILALLIVSWASGFTNPFDFIGTWKITAATGKINTVIVRQLKL